MFTCVRYWVVFLFFVFFVEQRWVLVQGASVLIEEFLCLCREYEGKGGGGESVQKVRLDSRVMCVLRYRWSFVGIRFLCLEEKFMLFFVLFFRGNVFVEIVQRFRSLSWNRRFSRVLRFDGQIYYFFRGVGVECYYVELVVWIQIFGLEFSCQFCFQVVFGIVWVF